MERAGRARHMAAVAASELGAHFGSRPRDAATRLRDGTSARTSVEQLHAGLQALRMRHRLHMDAYLEHGDLSELAHAAGDEAGADAEAHAGYAHGAAAHEGYMHDVSRFPDRGMQELVETSEYAFRASQRVSRRPLDLPEAQLAILDSSRAAMVENAIRTNGVRAYLERASNWIPDRAGMTSVEQAKLLREAFQARAERHESTASMHRDRAAELATLGDRVGSQLHTRAAEAHQEASHESVDDLDGEHATAAHFRSDRAHLATLETARHEQARVRHLSHQRPAVPQLTDADLTRLNEIVGRSAFSPEAIRRTASLPGLAPEVREAALCAADMLERAGTHDVEQLRETFGAGFVPRDARMSVHALWAIRNALAGSR